MKILLDQNVDARLKEFLESKNYEVNTTYEEDLSAESDKAILEYSLENDYIILTHDDDFLSLIEEMDESPTIIFLPQRIRFREMKTRIKQLDQEIPAMNQEIYP